MCRFVWKGAGALCLCSAPWSNIHGKCVPVDRQVCACGPDLVGSTPCGLGPAIRTRPAPAQQWEPHESGHAHQPTCATATKHAHGCCPPKHLHMCSTVLGRVLAVGEDQCSTVQCWGGPVGAFRGRSAITAFLPLKDPAGPPQPRVRWVQPWPPRLRNHSASPLGPDGCNPDRLGSGGERDDIRRSVRTHGRYDPLTFLVTGSRPPGSGAGSGSGPGCSPFCS